MYKLTIAFIWRGNMLRSLSDIPPLPAYQAFLCGSRAKNYRAITGASNRGRKVDESLACVAPSFPGSLFSASLGRYKGRQRRETLGTRLPAWQAVERKGSQNERGRGKGSSRVRFFCALCARLSRFPPLRTPAT